MKDPSLSKKKIEKLEKSESRQKPTETALRESEHKYRQLAEDMPALICTFLPDSTLTYVNKAYCELFQKRPDELVGQKFLDFLPDEATRENVRSQYMSLTPENPVKTYEHKVIVSDGTDQYHWHRWTDRAFFSDNGQISHFQSIGQDTTERKQVEEALREAEEKYRSIFENAPEGIIQTAADGRVMGANPALAHIFGYTSSAEMIAAVTDIGDQFDISPEERQEHLRSINEKGEMTGFEARVRRANGNSCWVSINARTVRNSSGEPVHYEGFMTDITDRKRVEEALRKSQEQLRNTHRLAHIGIWDWIADTDTVTWSEELYSIIGRDPMLPAPTYAEHPTIYTPESWEVLKTAVKRAMETGELYQLELELIHPDGSTRCVNTFGGVKYDTDGRVNGLYGIVQDITDRKQVDEELAKHRQHLEDIVKERTADLEIKNITLQELNTALRVLLKQREDDKKDLEERLVMNLRSLVLPFVELMKKGRLDPGQRPYLDIIETHIHDIATPLLKNIRQFNLTPMEIKVAALVKQGKPTKGVAEILGLAASSIDVHRKNIRKKLGLSIKKANLQSYLESLG